MGDRGDEKDTCYGAERMEIDIACLYDLFGLVVGLCCFSGGILGAVENM